MGMQPQVVPESNPALELEEPLPNPQSLVYLAWNPEVLRAILPQCSLRIAQSWKVKQELQGQGPGLEWPVFHSA